MHDPQIREMIEELQRQLPITPQTAEVVLEGRLQNHENETVFMADNVLAKCPESSGAICVEASGGHPICDFLFNKLPYPSENQIIGSFWWFVCFWLSVVAVFLAVGFGFYVFHWAPANFVGLLSFLGLHTAITGFRQLLLSIY